MSNLDIFISYKSERRAIAEHLHDLFEDHGYSVWFDYALVPGHAFDAEIENNLRAAKCVIALWCTRSVASEWVRAEVALARKLKKLVPVMIERTEIPLPFNLLQTIDLTGWSGRPTMGSPPQVFAEVERLTGRAAKPNMPSLTRFERAWERGGCVPPMSFQTANRVEAQSGKPGFAPEDTTAEPVIAPPGPSEPPPPPPVQDDPVGEIYNGIDKSDFEALRRFADHFSDHPRASEANKLADQLEQEANEAAETAAFEALIAGYHLRALSDYIANHPGTVQSWRASERIAEINRNAPDDETRHRWEKEAQDAILKGRDIPEDRLPYILHFDLSGSDLSDLMPLSGLTSLQTLDIEGTQVSDLGPLSGLTSLQTLVCTATQVSDLGPLSGLASLHTLLCGDTEVSELRPLSGLTNLQTLDVRVTKVKDLSPVSHIKGLEIEGP